VLRRRLRAEDVDAIEALVARTGFFTAEECAIARELAVERLARGPVSGYEFLLAQEEETVLGYACWGPAPQTVDSWDLYWIVVDPRLQRSGLGSRLLAEVERRVVEAGGGLLWIETAGREMYAPTHRFYERHGFEQGARLRDFYAPGDDKVVYVKRLRAEART
jgi:ribosomal protein S18 acetylase RimI-like enzyme